MFNLLVRLVRDRALAEDLAQETFVRAFRRLETFDTGRRFASWIFTIAHHVAVDALRRRPPATVPLVEGGSGGTAAGLEAPDPSPAASAEGGMLAAAIDEALGTLRVEHREALVLRYQEDLSYDEIALVLGVPVATAKTFVHRGRRALADRLAAMGWGGPRR